MLPFVIHPAVVHFPLAMLFAAWVCLIALHATGAEAWDPRVRLFELTGVVTTPVVIVTGFIDDGGLVFDLVLDDPVTWHAIAAVTASAVAATHWRWRRSRSTADLLGRAATVDLWWATAATWLFVLAGAIGGEMVHA